MRIRTLTAAVSLFLMRTAIAQDGQVLLPNGCSMVCAETYLRAGMPTDNGSGTDKEAVAASIKAAYDRATADNAALWVGGHALRYVGAAVGDQEFIGAGPAADIIADGAEKLIEVHDELVAYSVAVAVDQDAAKILRENGRLDAGRARSIVNALTDPNVWQGMPAETRAALSSVQERINSTFLTEAYQNGLENKDLLQGLGNDSKAIAEKLNIVSRSIESGRVAIVELRDFAKQQDERLTDIEDNQRKWMNITSQNLSATQQLVLQQQGVIARSDKEVAVLMGRVKADEVLAASGKIAGAMQGLASGLAAVGMEKEAAFVNQGANLVGAVGTLAAGYFTSNPMMMAQGGLAAFGAISSFGKGSGPSAESKLLVKVLEEIHEMRKQIAKYHEEEMKALVAISGQIASSSAEMLAKQDQTLYQLGTIEAGIKQIQLTEVLKCDEMLRRMAENAVLGTRQFARSDLGTASDWFNNSGNQYFVPCKQGLAGIVTKARPPLWPEISSIFLLDQSTSPDVSAPGNGVASDGGEPTQVRTFVFRTLRPLASYADHYVNPSKEQWIAKLQGFSMKLEEIDREMRFVADASASVEAKDLLPAGERLMSSGRTVHFASLSADVAPIASMVSYPNQAFHMATPNDIERCAKDRKCRMWGLSDAISMLEAAENAVNVAISQEVLLSGAPILPTIVDTLENDILPKYAIERSMNLGTPLSDELSKVIPQPTSDAGNGSAQSWATANSELRAAAARCETKNKIYDTLCLLQTNPWLASNAISLLVYRQGLKIAPGMDSDEIYRTTLSSIDVNVVRPWFTKDSRVNDLARLNLPAAERRTAPLWAIELPRIDVPPFEYSKTYNETIAQQPGSCWESIGLHRLPPLKSYLKDGRWTQCMQSPPDIRADRLLTVRRDSSQKDKSHYWKLLMAKRQIDDARWVLGVPNTKLSDGQRELVMVALGLPAPLANPAPVSPAVDNSGGVP